MVSNLGLVLEDALRDAGAKGMSGGRPEGMSEGIFEAARKMLLDNVDVDTIAKFTGLSFRQIQELKEQIKQ